MKPARRRRAKIVDPVQVRHILVADDGSGPASRAGRFAVMLAVETGARLTAVYVREPMETPEEAAGKLAVTLAAAEAAGLPCRTLLLSPVGITNAGRRILSAATRHGADHIVVGARGSGLVHKLLGSVSDYVVARARVSVSVVR